MSNPDRSSDVDATLAPPSDQTLAAEREARLIKVVRDYMSAVEAGHKPNRHDLVAHHPDIATELSACLAGLQFVNSAAAGLDPTSGSAISPIDPADLANGQPLGDFKLVRELGRGGMGVVYEAVQISLTRRVALKVLPLAAALDSRHLQRFRNEAQAAAQLHHSNIVPVYFVGCERSVHFYAMQLIQGQTLAEVTNEIREGQNSAGRASQYLLDLRTHQRADYFRAVAKLGMQAADGLDYAHRTGVVHRDIKPSNLMLDIKGNVWITDFGLAQFYSDNNLTQEGDLLGTLRYMSPEQATGKAGVVLDQRTDVYSLGITLYELLTLERALPGETREQLLSQIGLHEPRPPRAIDKLIPRELEIILAKATAKEAGDRYQTAGALAEDFRRFLADEPILACSPSLVDKAIKWTRRHRAIAISTLAALLLLAIGLAVSTVLIARQEHLAQSALNTAETERQHALKSEKQARDVVDYLSRVAAEELADEPQAAAVRKEMLEAVLDYYRSFIEAGSDNSPTPELATAQAHAQEILTDLAAVDVYMQTSVRSSLLAEISVAQALNLTAQQTSLIQQTVIPLLDEVSNRREMRQMTDDQKKKYFGDLAAKIDATTRKILADPQYHRLLEIARQFRGPGAFSDDDVLAALKLTTDQKEAIRKIQADHRAAMRQLQMQHNTAGPRDPQRLAERKLRQAALAKILALLDSEQKAAWKQLTGEPFAGAIRDPGRLGLGPQPGGPDPRGPNQPPDQRGPRQPPEDQPKRPPEGPPDDPPQ